MELNEKTSGQPQDNSVVSEPEAVKNPDAVLAKNRELLNEKRALAEKVAQFESERRELELQKKEAEGKKDEVIAALREENNKLKDSNSKKDAAYNWKTVSSQIKDAARDKGCTSPDKLLKLLEENKEELAGGQLASFDFSITPFYFQI